ncbi:hypothetical protein [Peribacillus muralis]|uniref:hypothetical protein n=1 Tax=Peribacillus muralis TaxID=264697 RepID=UPI0012E99478
MQSRNWRVKSTELASKVVKLASKSAKLASKVAKLASKQRKWRNPAPNVSVKSAIFT